MKYLFATIVYITILVPAQNIYLNQLSVPLECDLAFNEDLSVLHCKHYASIIQKGVPANEITFDNSIENPRVFLEPSGLIYLIRDQDIITIDPQFNYQEVNSLPKTTLHPNKIDLQTEFIITDDYLFYKPQGSCQLIKVDLDPDEEQVTAENVIDLRNELSDCVLNFTIYKTVDDRRIIAFVKEFSMLVNISYSDFEVTQKSLIISPEVWIGHFDYQQVNARDGLVILSTWNEFSQEVCHYLFVEDTLHFHFEEVLDCYKTKEWHKPKVHFVSNNEFIVGGNKITKYKKAGELRRSDKYSADFSVEKFDFITVDHCSLDFLQNEVKLKKTSELKDEDENNNCSQEEICLKKSIEISDETYATGNLGCFELKASSLKDPKITSIALKLFKTKNCDGPCISNSNSELCISCIYTLFTEKAQTNCISQVNIHSLLDSQFYPKVVEKKCEYKIKRIDDTTMSLELEPTKFGFHCNFVLDLGVLKYLVSEVSPILEGSYSLNFYEDIKKLPKKHQITDQKMIVEENVKFLGINFENLDKPLTIQLHSGSFYLHSMICQDYCIKCLIEGWSDRGFHFNDFYTKRATYKNEWASHTCFESKTQTQTSVKSAHIQNWYQCFSLNETYSESLAVCQIHHDSSGNRIFITFNKDKGKFPFCKTYLQLSSLASLDFDFDGREDIAIRIADEYVSLRTLAYDRGYQLANIHKLANTLAEVELYYLNMNPLNKMPDSRVIEVSYDVSKNYTGQIAEILKKSVVIGLVVGIAILIIKLCKCNTIFSIDRIRKISQICPYQIADFISGNPKEVKMSAQQMEDLTKAGFAFTYEKKPVDIEDDVDCFICLRPLKEQEYRIFLCGVHFTHTKCFKAWLKGREANNFAYLCPLRCGEIAMSDPNDEYIEDTLFEFDDDEEANTPKNGGESPREGNKTESQADENKTVGQREAKKNRVEQERRNSNRQLAKEVAEALGEDIEDNRDFSRNTSEGVLLQK